MNSQFDSTNNNNNRAKLVAKWNRIDDASGGPTPRPRHGHRGVAIKELMLVFGGGNEGIVDELHVYDVVKNKWFVPLVRGEIPHGFAAYGMVSLIGQGKVFIFGGMVEYGKYSNDVYELQTTRWEWRNLRVRPANGVPGPCPRLGHSFTLGMDYYAYVFGGLANDSDDPKSNQPRYLNDLYVINLGSPSNSLYWEYMETNGISPPPRESHTAVHFVTSSGKEQLIIYGGMDGQRMNDVWILDLMNMNWSNPLPHGVTPVPRSLHTANVIGNRMFVFGGWVPMEPTDKIEHPDKEWKCTNTLAILNLNSLTWEQPMEPTTDSNGMEPGARAGHSAVVINKRVYIWSGRDGYKKSWHTQVCCDDMWYLEVEAPASPTTIQLVRASVNSLEIQWPAIVNADKYILQIQRVEQHNEDQKVQTGRRIIRAAMPFNPGAVRMVRPVTYYRQPRPTGMAQHSPVVSGLSHSFPPTAIRAKHQIPQAYNPSPRVIMRNSAPGGIGETGTPNQAQKIMVLQPTTGEVTNSNGGFNVLSQTEQTAAFLPTNTTTPTTTTKTTYTAPVAPAIDILPTNILDEALNEAESLVEEQIQQQQKQLEQQEKSTNEHKNSPENNHKEEKKNDEIEETKKEEMDPSSIEQMRATPDDLKDVKDSNQAHHQQQSQQENEPLNEDLPIDEGGGRNEWQQQQKEESNFGQATSSKSAQETENAKKIALSNAAESEQETSPSYSLGGTKFMDNNQMAPTMVGQRVYQQANEEWCDVSTLTENKIIVTEYSNAENQQIKLEPGIFYRFRVCAINSVGQSKWSPVNNFKTCIPGFPGAPSSIKITKGTNGANISWEPPQTTNGQIIEYSVYLAMRSATSPAFVPVYIGQLASCVVNNQNLQLAHIDMNPKPAIIFRIAARNEKGYGPATQVRWLQEHRPPLAVMAPMPPMAHQHGLKRVYSSYHHQPSPVQPQMVHSPGAGYYAQISGPRYQHSPATSNLDMIQPQTMGPHRIQSTPPAYAIQNSQGPNVYGYSASSPQQPPIQVHIQRQQQNVSPQHHQQMQTPPSIIHQHGEEGNAHQHQQEQDETINSGMTVREYLIGAGKKKLRTEQA